MVQEQSLPTDASMVGADKVRVVKADGSSVIMLASDAKDYMASGTSSQYIVVVDDGDDKGLICTEQWSVGKPGDGKESVFGEGDSYGVGKEDTTPDGTPVAGSAWHCDISNTTGLTITSATDVTVVMASDSESTAPLFNGVGAGKYILVGSEYKFGGSKMKIDTVGVIEPDNVVGEYLATSAGWVNAPFMATDSDYPYTQHGNKLGTCASCSEQWRFGFNPLDVPVTWDKVTLNINGVDYTKYWARFRVTSDITTDPIMQQIKLHTNRFEINGDGNTEYFGRARYPKTIAVEKKTNALKNPANENITIAVGITEVRADNEFQNGASDGLILSGLIPEGMDTSIPAQIVVDWYVKGAGAGDVELEFEAVSISKGAILDGSLVPSAAAPAVTSINNQDEELQQSTFLVPVSSAIPGDKFYGSLFRDASGGNPDDTFSGNIVIAGYTVVGYFWKP